MFLDRATPAPGEYNLIACGICDVFMNVKRNVCGPTSMAEASVNLRHLHDSFQCPNIEKDWHIQAKMIQEVARKTPSKVVEQALLKEASDIIFNRHATKKVIEL